MTHKQTHSPGANCRVAGFEVSTQAQVWEGQKRFELGERRRTALVAVGLAELRSVAA